MLKTAGILQLWPKKTKKINPVRFDSSQVIWVKYHFCCYKLVLHGFAMKHQKIRWTYNKYSMCIYIYVYLYSSWPGPCDTTKLKCFEAWNRTWLRRKCHVQRLEEVPTFQKGNSKCFLFLMKIPPIAVQKSSLQTYFETAETMVQG